MPRTMPGNRGASVVTPVLLAVIAIESLALAWCVSIVIAGCGR